MIDNNINIQKHTVAFFDILGFKNKVQSTELSDLVMKYNNLLNLVNSQLNKKSPQSKNSLFPNHQNDTPYCHSYFFSDSIILFSLDSSEESCLKLLVFAWKFFQFMLASDFPVRGAICYGDMYLNLESKIFLGKTLIKAYELEQKQEWIGAIIDNSIFEAFPNIEALCKKEDSLFNSLFYEYDVPLKNNLSGKFHTINWRFNLVIKNGTRSILKYLQDPKIQDIKYFEDYKILKKLDNTLRYSEKIVSTGQLYSSGEMPEELTVLWIGDSEPPFQHGDEF